MTLNEMISKFGTNWIVKLARHSMTMQSRLPSLHLSLTDYCFNTCPMCGHWKRKQKYHANTKSLLEFLSFCKNNMQLETVGLTGGDPLAHPDIAIILEYLYDLDIVYGVVTAGYMPKDLTKLLAKAKWVRVSLDAVDGKIYSKARGGIATAERVISSLAMMANAGCNLQFGITVNKLNAHHLPQILTKIKVMKEAFGNISEVMVRAVCHHSDAMRATSIPDVDDQVAELKAFDISCDIELTRDPLLPIEHCYATMYQLYPAADGNVYPCCMTAADSEVTPHCRPLFNYENLLSYKEPIHALMAARLAWIQVQPDKLPAICKQDCPTRLNVMNFCAPHLLNLKNFY